MILLFALFLAPLVVDGRVSFEKSEVLDNVDLKGTNTASFRCSGGCRIFSPSQIDTINIIRDGDGSNIGSFDWLSQHPEGIDLEGGNYYLNNTGPSDPSFIFYAVEIDPRYYHPPMFYVTSDKPFSVYRDATGPVTFMSTTGAVTFSGFSGGFEFVEQEYLPTVYATGFDTIDLHPKESCRPVFTPSSRETLVHTSFPVLSPIATVNIQVTGKSFVVSGATSQSTMAADSSAVYVSPGYVGCSVVGDSLYTFLPPVGRISQYFRETEANGLSVTINADYNIEESYNAIDLTVNNDVLKLYGKSSITRNYDDTDFYISINADTYDLGRKDRYVVQVDISSKNSSAITTTPAPIVRTSATTVAPIIISTATTLAAQNSTGTTASPATNTPGPYCKCEVDKFSFPIDWNYNDIWEDIVVILDTSEAMGEESLEAAGELIESFISPDGIDDFLITDTSATFYTRIGVISMAETATTLYNLNMTKHDSIQGKTSIKKGVLEIDVVTAFNAALSMLNDGLKTKPERAKTRQVVYYMTDSDPKNDLSELNKFKYSQGVIIVNNFLKSGETELLSLKELASPGYYFNNGDYVAAGLQSFCKANCFCGADRSGYNTNANASGGCYHATPTGLPFNKAKKACANEGGILATIHDDQKGVFLQQLMASVSTKDYFWIGYEKSDNGSWIWEDASTDPYTNWDVNEPSTNSVAKCGYASIKWGAGNCNAAFPYVCQYPPCSAGNKDC